MDMARHLTPVIYKESGHLIGVRQGGNQYTDDVRHESASSFDSFVA